MDKYKYFMDQDNTVYNNYKPLRNHLNKLVLDDSFYVIWSYIQHYQFNNKFPQDIEVALEFLNQDHIQKIRMCSEWELETITREIIINAQNSTFSDKSLKAWSYFSGSINKLKSIENEIGGMFVNKDNILVELFRISHRQFPWQISPNGEYLTRYYKILEEIKKIKDEKEQKEILGNFGNSLGKQFQNYVGEVLEKSIQNISFKFFKEQEYKEGKNRKDTVDWMVIDNNAMLFIECKAKRMNLPAKIELNDDSFIKAELDKMADFIKQVYKSIDDYKNNKYPNIKYDKSRKIFPIILTLEHWYLFGDKFLNELDVILKNKIKENNLDEKYLEIYPYSICSIEEFEKMTQIIDKIGVNNFMSKKFDQDRRLWAFQSFMNSDFNEEYKKTKVLFDDDYKKIFEEVLKEH